MGSIYGRPTSPSADVLVLIPTTVAERTPLTDAANERVRGTDAYKDNTIVRTTMFEGKEAKIPLIKIAPSPKPTDRAK